MERNNITGIVMATNLEADSLIDSLDLSLTSERPFKIYKKKDIVLISSGIGKVYAAMATLYLILEYHPRRVLNLGAAGALTQNHPLGAVYQIKKVAEPDRPLIEDNSLRFHIPDRLEGFVEAVLSTRDEGVVAPLDRKAISAFADLADMEGGAVVQACKRLKTPCYLFKFVSDTPDHTGHNDIVTNIEEYRENFASYVKDKILTKFHDIEN